MVKTLASGKDMAETRERVRTLCGAEARRWGRMSVGEMVCHLRESFRWAMDERSVATVGMALPGPMIKWIALRSPMRWPKGVETVPELRLGGEGLAPLLFAEDKAGLLEQMALFVGAKENRAAHSIFGRMQPEDWMRWGYLHMDHHLRQFGR